MFIDNLGIYQDHDEQLPFIGDRAFLTICTATQEQLGTSQPIVQHEGSHSTTITIKVTGNRVTVKGNPSRVDRLDNLVGFSDLDQCVQVYNRILKTYGLPPFTRATKKWQVVDRKGNPQVFTDGAKIIELHVTTNLTVGKDNEDAFISAMSTQTYRNSIPRLLDNGKTTDWLSKKHKRSTLIYPCVYNKAYEIELNTLPKIKKRYGIESPEYQYLKDVVKLCSDEGVVRFEQKLRSAGLRRYNCQFYGFENMAEIRELHEEFLNLRNKLQVEAMTLESITQTLLRMGICNSTKAANTTTLYAIQWMHGEVFDLSKRQVKEHRARLKKIGIDIARQCDITKFSLVTVKEARQIQVSGFNPPNWYRKPTVQLQVAA